MAVDAEEGREDRDNGRHHPGQEEMCVVVGVEAEKCVDDGFLDDRNFRRG